GAGAALLRGRVLGPDGAAVPGAAVTLRNEITAFHAETTAGTDGGFQLFNVPFNPYELHVEATGFRASHQRLELRAPAPPEVKVNLALAARTEAITVSGEPTAAQVETDSSTSHVDIDKSYIARAPASRARTARARS